MVASGKNRGESSRRGVGRTLFFAIAPLVLLLGLGELLVWWLVPTEAQSGGSLSRGFDRHESYLLPQEGAGGGWQTAMFDRGEEIVIPPRDDRIRILLFGGSNTQRFSGDLLEQRFDALGPKGRYEVVNLGREGYGSERVSILVEQAMVLEPDVVVIYSGHNEFIERGFRAEVEDSLPPMLSPLGELRVARWLMNLFDRGKENGRETPSRGSGPEPWEMAYPQFAEIVWPETQRYMDAFENNLERIVDISTEAGALVLLCTPVGNHLSPPFVSTLARETPPLVREILEQDLAQARALLPKRFLAAVSPPLRVRARDWDPFQDGLKREAALFMGRQKVAVPLRPLSGVLAELPSWLERPDQTGTWTLWPPPALWMDKVFDLVEAISDVHHPALTSQETMAVQEALQRYRSIVDRHPDHPRALFMVGLCALVLGRSEESREHLEAAARFDRAPRRAGESVYERIRSVSRNRESVTLMDAADIFARRSPDGIVGYEVMADHCHLHPGAEALLMEDLAQAIHTAWLERGR